ncbi:MAG: hypothetical protein ACI4GA_02865 [Acutalibacteraceae bacterium]|nr:hypothetical protein [Oscillospiraceae bacterium]
MVIEIEAIVNMIKTIIETIKNMVEQIVSIFGGSQKDTDAE